MFTNFFRRISFIPYGLVGAFVLCLFGTPTCFALSPENVLVLYNADEGVGGDGFQIAQHYQGVRNGVHVAGISGLNSLPPDSYLGEVRPDTISAQDYLNVLRPQILNEITAIEDATGHSIDVIVTTKGMPLRINAGSNPGGFSSWNQFSSLESELTRIDSIDTVSKMGNQTFIASFPQIDFNLASNPYFQYGPVPTSFSGQGGIRLSSRLDGYSVQSVTDAIDRAQHAFIVPYGQYIVADDTGFFTVDQMTNAGGFGGGLVEQVTALYPDDGSPVTPTPLLFDQTNTAITEASRPVLGYVSHGTNDGGGAGSLGPNYLGEFVGDQFEPGEINFNLANGALFLTHESYNAESFDPNLPQSQGQVADWLENGGTGGLGHVAEPDSGPENIANEDLLYEMMLPTSGANATPGESGFTFVEAAWGATRQLSYVNTVVGDPLMRFRAWLPGDTNLDGLVNFLDFSSFQSNFFDPGSYADGDFTGDGVVNIADFGILQQNFAQDLDDGSLGPTAIQSVPEPGALVLLWSTVFKVICRPKRVAS